MYELVRAGEKTYYIENPSKIGIYLTGNGSAVAIDSGNDKDAGKKVKKIMDANGWKLEAIYNTHSNADHIGGNRYLQNQTGCRIYVPGTECAFTRHPLLEPSYLYGGFPPKELRSKFLMAEGCEAEYLTPSMLPEGLTSFPLPGHFFDMAGFLAEDGTAFIADSLCSREILDKYRISVIFDVAAYLETLEKVKTMEAKLFVPSHAAATDDIAPLCDYNRKAVFDTASDITDICKEPLTSEEILERIFNLYGRTMTFDQYVLVGSTVRSYLTWLRNEGKVEAMIENNRLLWKRV